MIVAGTGHRPDKLGGYSKEAFETLVKIAENWLIKNKPEKVISGMALGWDMALARAAYLQKIPFVAAVPCEGQELKWNIVQQVKYHHLLSKAEEIVFISKSYSPVAMQVRNEWMVDRADLILAMYDGSKGGTSNCILYAKDKKKPIVNLYPLLKRYYDRKTHNVKLI